MYITMAIANNRRFYLVILSITLWNKIYNKQHQALESNEDRLSHNRAEEVIITRDVFT
jgi:hypothetical protein